MRCFDRDGTWTSAVTSLPCMPSTTFGSPTCTGSCCQSSSKDSALFIQNSLCIMSVRFVDRWAQDTEKKSAQDIALEKKVKYSLAHFKRQNPFSQTLLTAAAFNSYPAQFPYVSPGFCSEQPYSELRDGSRATSKLAGSQTTARAMGRAQTPTIFSGSASQRARSSTSPRSGLRARLARSRILLTPWFRAKAEPRDGQDARLARSRILLTPWFRAKAEPRDGQDVPDCCLLSFFFLLAPPLKACGGSMCVPRLLPIVDRKYKHGPLPHPPQTKQGAHHLVVMLCSPCS